MIRFSCPLCAKRLKVLPEHAGGIVRCPRCRTRVETPPDDFANAPSVFVPVDSPPCEPAIATARPSQWLLFVGSVSFWLQTFWSLFWLFAFFVSKHGVPEAIVCLLAWSLVWPLTFAIAIVGAMVDGILDWLRRMFATAGVLCGKAPRVDRPIVGSLHGSPVTRIGVHG